MPARSRRAETMKAERQEDMREKIRNAGLLKNALDSIEEMEEIRQDMRGDEYDEDGKVTKKGNLGECTSKLNAMQMVNNQRFKLIDKILPDLKHVEMDGELGMKVVEINRTGVYDDDEDQEDEDG